MPFKTFPIQSSGGEEVTDRKRPEIAAANVQPFRRLAASLKRLTADAQRIYALEVDAIIKSRCREAHRIETALDGILGYCFDSDMLLLFKRLCRHYFKIDPAATASYIHIYRDMWDNEGEAGE